MTLKSMKLALQEVCSLAKKVSDLKQNLQALSLDLKGLENDGKLPRMPAGYTYSSEVYDLLIKINKGHFEDAEIWATFLENQISQDPAFNEEREGQIENSQRGNQDS